MNITQPSQEAKLRLAVYLWTPNVLIVECLKINPTCPACKIDIPRGDTNLSLTFESRCNRKFIGRCTAPNSMLFHLPSIDERKIVFCETIGLEIPVTEENLLNAKMEVLPTEVVPPTLFTDRQVVIPELFASAGARTYEIDFLGTPIFKCHTLELLDEERPTVFERIPTVFSDQFAIGNANLDKINDLLKVTIPVDHPDLVFTSITTSTFDEFITKLVDRVKSLEANFIENREPRWTEIPHRIFEFH